MKNVGRVLQIIGVLDLFAGFGKAFQLLPYPAPALTPSLDCMHDLSLPLALPVNQVFLNFSLQLSSERIGFG